MIRIGITGQSGFIGSHLYNTIGLYPDEFERILFKDEYFQNLADLRLFVKNCDIIVHLAAMNRHSDPHVIYSTNLVLVKQLIEALEFEKVNPFVLFSSSTQEEQDNVYGKSKREGRELLEKWAKRNKASFTGLIVPNVFGPFGKPNYNSFIATFCYKLVSGENPEIIKDNHVNLIYVGSLCKYILDKVRSTYSYNNKIERDIVPPDFEKSVFEILSDLNIYRELYFDKGIIPGLRIKNDINLFNTFRSYIDHAKYFPVKLIKHSDNRGVFVETIKLGVGGQVSFSTTKPNITRGNHYHTRKIERFTIIKGKALIQLRRINTSEVLNFELDGENPSYVDMPIWYTHNITNIGSDELYTQFWINEWFNAEDGDTYFENV